MTLTADQILYVIEVGDFESIKEDGQILFLIDLKPVLTIPAEPVPQVSVTAGNVVQVLSGDELVFSTAAESQADADAIADAFAGLLECAA